MPFPERLPAESSFTGRIVDESGKYSIGFSGYANYQANRDYLRAIPIDNIFVNEKKLKNINLLKMAISTPTKPVKSEVIYWI